MLSFASGLSVDVKFFIIFCYKAFSSKLGYEEHIPGQTRDWNEELQTTRELPRKNLPERLLRERAIFKVMRHLRYLLHQLLLRYFDAKMRLRESQTFKWFVCSILTVFSEILLQRSSVLGFKQLLGGAFVL